MKLTDICTSREVSEKLKAAGFPQESLFYWSKEDIARELPDARYKYGIVTSEQIFANQGIAAPTAAELGEQLPIGVRYFTSVDEPGKWVCWYKNLDVIRGDNEADARAKMWLFLKQHQLLQGE